jgi:hypothetical protein
MKGGGGRTAGWKRDTLHARIWKANRTCQGNLLHMFLLSSLPHVYYISVIESDVILKKKMASKHRIVVA